MRVALKKVFTVLSFHPQYPIRTYQVKHSLSLTRSFTINFNDSCKSPPSSLTALRSVRSPPILSAFKFYLLFISKCQMLYSALLSSVYHLWSTKKIVWEKKNRVREDWRMIFNDSASLNLLLILIIIFCFILTKQCFTNCVQFQKKNATMYIFPRHVEVISS